MILRLAKKIVFLLVLCLIGSCNDPLEGLQLQLAIDDDSNISTITVQFVDTNSSTEIPFEDISISVSGPNATSILSQNLNRRFSVNEFGFLTLVVKSQSEVPIQLDFTVTAKLSNYLTTSRNITTTNAEAQYVYINMVNLSSPPEGISVQEINFNTDSQGATTQEMSFQTYSYDQEGASVTIPNGTIMKDAKGRPVTGNVTAQLVYFSPNSPQALEAFPGGLDNISLREEEGYFVFETAGLVAINMHSETKEVKTFSEPIKVEISISSATSNPENNYEPVKAGDIIPVWSLNEGASSWDSEGNALVYEQSGELYATLSVSHLSYWNLDWWFSSCNTSSINMSFDSNFKSGYYYTRIYNSQTGQYLSSGYKYFADQEMIYMYRVPQNTSLEIKIFDGYYWCNNTKEIATSESFDACQAQSISFTATGDTSPLEEISFDLSATCPNNPDVVFYPSAYIYYKDPSGCRYWQYLGYMKGGVFSTNKLKVGTEYQFYTSVWVGGRWMGYEDFNYTISDNEITKRVEIPNDKAAGACF
ncbi:hypothetical protein V6R21_09385 [Limibacter armeniacum]|uniref:hypothetical protein n=1 Tax=Limibacter armeniacum TaxID=466084 RepID=UPI002FE53D5A